MSVRHKFVAAVLVGCLGSGIGLTAATAATASSVLPASVGTALPVSGPVSAGVLVSLPAGGSSGLAPVGAGTVPGGGVSTPNVAIWIRIAVQAALAVIKSRSIATYRAIATYVQRGKVVFNDWWSTSVPSWVKGLLGGITGNALYDAIKWILGL